MKIPLVVVAALVMCGCQETKHAQERRATDALAALGGPRMSGVWTTRVYEGEATVEGHFPLPHEKRTYPTRVAVTSAPGQSGETADWSIWWQGKDAEPSVRTLCGVRGIVSRGAPGAPWQEQTWEDRRWSRVLLSCLDPRDAIRLYAGPWPDGVEPFGAEHRLVYERGELRAWEAAYGHERLGDAVDRVEYGEDGAAKVTLHRPDDIYWLDLRLVSDEPAAAPPLDPLAAGVPIEPARERDPARQPRIAPHGDNLFEVVHEGVDTRMLVAEFVDHLILLEAGVNTRTGEVMADALAAQWPGKPVRHVLFSHHHPHYTGGLRAFIAGGATVVTPPGREPLVREIAALPFTRVPDRLARAPRPVRTETFTGTRVFDDGTNRLEAIDIGMLSDHTQEYLVFWFPRQRILFEGDIGFYGSEGTVRVSRRAKGLLQAIDERNLPVERLVQSWPVIDSPPWLAMEEFRALVTKP